MVDPVPCSNPETGSSGTATILLIQSGRWTEAGCALQEPRWGLLGLSVAQMQQRLRADVVAAHAEIFLINGDINSNLYTSSRAMHSAIIGLLQVGRPALSFKAMSASGGSASQTPSMLSLVVLLGR